MDFSVYIVKAHKPRMDSAVETLTLPATFDPIHV